MKELIKKLDVVQEIVICGCYILSMMMMLGMCLNLIEPTVERAVVVIMVMVATFIKSRFEEDDK